MQEALMQSKIKLLVLSVVILSAIVALTFTFYRPAQTVPEPPPDPLPKLWGYVTYDKWCPPTDHDTVWVENGYSQSTLVYQDGSDYKYEFETVYGPEGYRTVFGRQGSSGCNTRNYIIYWEYEDIQRDIEFKLNP
jgi:hypothetical protein